MALPGSLFSLAGVFEAPLFTEEDVRVRLERWGFEVQWDSAMVLFARAEESLLKLSFLQRRRFESRLREAGWACLLPDAPPPEEPRILCARIAFTLCRTLRFLSLGRQESPNYFQKADAVFREGKPLFDRLSPSVPHAERIREDIAYVEEGCGRALHPSQTDTDV
ncbi:MAG: hypothetical protein J6Z49_08665 [Kiritimatiellae bacterium]|nr:hypothetical protein [Kiritimatiellia bacterium]